MRLAEWIGIVVFGVLAFSCETLSLRLGVRVLTPGDIAQETIDKEITVQSANIHLGDRLPEYARDCIQKVAAKFFGQLNTASVHFTREGITYRCSARIESDGAWGFRLEKVGKTVEAALAFGGKSAVAKAQRRARSKKKKLLGRVEAAQVPKITKLPIVTVPSNEVDQLGLNGDLYRATFEKDSMGAL